MIVFLNGKFVKKSQAKVSVFDRGFLFGDGVYEVLRTYGGNLFNVDAHLRRIFASARAISLRIPWSHKQLTKWLFEVVRRNHFPESHIRLVLTRGSGKRPTIVILVTRLSVLPRTVFEHGVSAITFVLDRPLAHIKTLNRISNVLAQIQAHARGAFEALFVTSRGFVTEGTLSNVFIVKKGKVSTPPQGVLAGTTRARIAKLVPMTERALRRTDLYRADECFISSTPWGIVPIVRVDGRKIGNGKVGPITKMIWKRFCTTL